MPDSPKTSQYRPSGANKTNPSLNASTAAEALAPRGRRTARLHLHRNRLHFRILQQTVLAEFPADSGLLETTERRPWIEHVVTIPPTRSGAHAVGDGERLLNIARPHRRRQAVVGAIGPFDHLVYIAERN